jgi:hypothetical protein
MPAFKHFTGNYIEVLHDLGFPPAFFEKQKPEVYDATIAKDLHRTCYLNFYGNSEEMKQRLADRTHLSEDNLNYAQGTLSGSIFPRVKISTLPKYRAVLDEDSPIPREHRYSGIDVHYIDDGGISSGFSLVFLLEDEVEIPFMKRQRHFAVSIIKDVINTPEQRQVTYISHLSLTHNENEGPMPESNGELMESAMVLGTIDAALNSKSISQLLKDIIIDENINIDNFFTLYDRIAPNHNIDDCDFLFDLFVLRARIQAFKPQTIEKTRIADDLAEIIDNAFRSNNYFKKKTINELSDLKALLTKYQKHPALADLPSLPKKLDEYAKYKEFTDYKVLQTELNLSFLSRNRNTLIFLSLAFLATVTLTLTLLGTFAPLGIALATDFAITVTQLAIGAAGTLTGLGLVNLALDEFDTVTKRNELQNDIELICAKERRDVAPLKEEFFAKISAKFTNDIQEPPPEKIKVEYPVTPKFVRINSDPLISLGRNRLSKFGRSQSYNNLHLVVMNLEEMVASPNDMSDTSECYTSNTPANK